MIIKSVVTRRVLKSKIVKKMPLAAYAPPWTLHRSPNPSWTGKRKERKERGKGGKRTGRKKVRVWDGVAQASVLQFVDPPVS